MLSSEEHDLGRCIQALQLCIMFIVLPLCRVQGEGWGKEGILHYMLVLSGAHILGFFFGGVGSRMDVKSTLHFRVDPLTAASIPLFCDQE